ncbi:MAG: hypothetical protein HUJ71_09905 [Pseudobutyrivibrio sp.]|nr:hypothetical protein [Pseudobutyrivibrio sp.]
MDRKLTIISENFENEKTGERVEGVTIIVDGMLKQVLEIIINNGNQYDNNVSIISDALVKGLDEIRKNL